MSRRVFSLALCALAFNAGLAAAAEPEFYLAGRTGVSSEGFDNAKARGDTTGDATAYYDSHDSDLVAVGAVAVGYTFEMPLRAEIEYAYRTTFQHDKRPTNNGSHNVNLDTQTQTLMLNGYYDFRNESFCTPFLGAGIGWARHATDATAYPVPPQTSFYESDRKSVNRFAWTLGGGLAFDLSEALILDVQYRYVDLGKGKWQNHLIGGNDTGHYQADLSAHEALLGLRYRF